MRINSRFSGSLSFDLQLATFKPNSHALTRASETKSYYHSLAGLSKYFQVGGCAKKKPFSTKIKSLKIPSINLTVIPEIGQHHVNAIS